MAQHNLTKLASQGRAYDESRVWTEEELTALLMLEQECRLTRVVAASYVRNGIMTVSAYNAAQEAGFAPKSLEDLRTEAIAAYSKKVRSDLGLDKVEKEVVTEKKEVVETDEVVSVPTATVVEPEELDETAEVDEPAEVDELEVKKDKNKGGK